MAQLSMVSLLFGSETSQQDRQDQADGYGSENPTLFGPDLHIIDRSGCGPGLHDPYRLSVIQADSFRRLLLRLAERLRHRSLGTNEKGHDRSSKTSLSNQ
ncbi:hypothetical protein [Stutzerimonas marianensis]|uniref:Uncharacterized protein n=1 Tax=Stutzerimonas marianensis TaxID=2929513 RepID=A0A9X1W0C0_9GAMM|nr:hypothetical protein [Pseudomonas marianensis]MCJ0972103.1 hypothetical protein [Pseudomonas marianensis]